MRYFFQDQVECFLELHYLERDVDFLFILTGFDKNVW
jgi:hypothetical protein